MSDRSKIEWTDATWNVVTGCTEVSPGCDHCYAKTFAERWRGTPGHYFENGFDVQLRPDKLPLPLTWRKPRKIFVNSMSDLFHKDVPDEYIARVFAVMAATPQHTYQLLTKRHGRMQSLLQQDPQNLLEHLHDEAEAKALYDAPWPLPNVWMGVSVENQQWADIRVRALLDTPAAVHWLSCEPLIGPVELTAWLDPSLLCRASCLRTDRTGAKPDCSVACRQLAGTMGTIDWVVAGGESGPGARPMAPAWVRSLRDQCRSADVPFLFKQWGEYGPRCTLALCGQRCSCAGTNASHPFEMHRVGKKAAGRELDGRTWDQYPERAA
jgi:protein gp37